MIRTRQLPRRRPWRWVWRRLRRVDWLNFLFLRYRLLGFLSTLVLSALVGIGGGWLVAVAGPIVTAALVVAVAGGLWVLRDIEVGYWGLVAVICLLPFGKLPVEIGLKPSFLDVAIGLLFFVWLTGLVTQPDRPFVTTPLGLPILVFLLLAVMTFVAGLGHAPLTPSVARHFVEVLLNILLFFVVVNSLRRPEQLARLTRVILLAGFATALLGIVLYLLPDSVAIDLLSMLGRFDYPVGPGVLRYIRDDPSLPQRATSTSVDPNVLGGLLIMVGALGAPQLFARRPVFPRRWTALILATVGICLVLTFSRGSFIGLGVALVVLALLRYRRLGLLLLLALLLIGLLPVTQTYVQHFIQGLRGEDLATQMRFGEYRDALTLIGRYPIFGVGFAGSPDIDTYVSVASVYLLMAVEMGVVGLTAFLVVMAVLFYRAWQAWHRLPRETLLEPLWWGFHAAIVGALVGGIFDHYFFNLNFQHSVAFFWLFVGLATVATEEVMGE